MYSHALAYERLQYKRRNLSKVAELAPECFPIVRKGCSNITEPVEELPYRWR